MRKSIGTREHQRVARLLRGIRIEAGLTQAEVAKKLAATQSFVSKYEAGERRLDVIELRTICKALGVDLAEFVRRFEHKV